MAKRKAKITKILIANRGEIACRVIHTARKMGIKTVAVYSDADARALHVKMADEAVHIGPAPAAESYLVIDKIIQACMDSGADAVHPGYGFLSENPAFARALQKTGIIFIGPAPESMEAMGLKDAAKTLMSAAGVPVTPGYHGEEQAPDFLKTQAKLIGYPVLIKAVAGGGGKGMRKVDKVADFTDSLASCQREARSSFGDDRVLIEKYISSPRHIEVQVFGDKLGNVIHLFERDCSLQRRHQKVIEEAPAPGMTKSVRKAMTDAAVKAAKAVNYVGAGTVEFIVDGSGPLRPDGFWFMEMNTRLQVEHPVTELVTGLDLVELQIRIAKGKKLPPQSAVKLSGHAVEARLYAEDPANDFLPSVGPLDILALPEMGRIDTGAEQGGEVSIYYDPMISKLIAAGQSRDEAITLLSRMCAETEVYPVKTNARFLLACLQTADFIKGKISTHFIANHDAALLGGGLSADLEDIARALAPRADGSLFGRVDGWRLNLPPRTVFHRSYQDQDIALPLKAHPLKAAPIKSWAGEGDFIACAARPEGDVVFVNGQAYLIGWPQGSAAALGGGNVITAPMPGKIIAVSAKPGDSVKAGDKLVVMEAMKMEMSLDAPRGGVIAQVNFAPGDLVSDGDVILEMES